MKKINKDRGILALVQKSRNLFGLFSPVVQKHYRFLDYWTEV
ncbi:MAG: hypothetical protein AB9869_09355 [Verrucomicrobiia bacterium]